MIKVLLYIMEGKAKIQYDPKNYAMAILEDLEDSTIPGFEGFKIFL